MPRVNKYTFHESGLKKCKNLENKVNSQFKTQFIPNAWTYDGGGRMSTPSNSYTIEERSLKLFSNSSDSSEKVGQGEREILYN